MVKKVTLFVLAAFLLGACAHQPIYNVDAHPTPVSAQKLPLAQIEKAIIEAGQSRGWKVEPIAAGKLRATQDQPKFSAQVDILYDQKSFTILHVGSRGMAEKGNTIHPHYNFWIRNLESDIDVRLANAGALAK